MWKNVVQTDRPHMTIYYGACALHSGQLRLHTHALSLSFKICNTYCFFTPTMISRTRLSVKLYEYCLSCYNQHFIRFHGTCEKLVSFFTKLTKCPTALRAQLLHRITPKSETTVESTISISLMPLSKMWFPWHRFSQTNKKLTIIQRQYGVPCMISPKSAQKCEKYVYKLIYALK